MNGHKLDVVAGTSFFASLLLHYQELYSVLSLLAISLAVILYGIGIWKALRRKND